MSCDIKAARAAYEQAAHQLKYWPLAPNEVRLAVELLGGLIDELEKRNQLIKELEKTMSYES